jgi:hypothetical protein
MNRDQVTSSLPQKAQSEAEDRDHVTSSPPHET